MNYKNKSGPSEKYIDKRFSIESQTKKVHNAIGQDFNASKNIEEKAETYRRKKKEY